MTLIDSGTLRARLQRHLLEPVDIAWLIAFRIAFGLALAVSMWRFIANDWVHRFFVEPQFFFKYWGFEWVTPLGGEQMHALVVTLGVLACCMAAGLAFRLSALLFAAGFSYLQLVDVTNYLNHYYLAALLAWLLALSPAARLGSVDAWLRRRLRRAEPSPAPRAARIWLYLFRIQVGIVYVGAGLAKLQPDWLLHAQPLRIWLAASAELPVLGPLLAIDGVPLLLSWLGFLFDSTIVVWLSIARTRPYAYTVVLAFHALTRLLFPIGMFPVIMALSALVFFTPSWPRSLLRHSLRLGSVPSTEPSERSPKPSVAVNAALLLAGLYCAVQLLVPFRCLAYGGNVLWHEQGMRFSWRVMVRAKGGSTTFIVKNRGAKKTWYISPAEYLTPLQESEMSSQPDLILQLAHHIRRDLDRRGLGPVEVRADARVSLNGRRGTPLVDPSIDLAAMSDSWAPLPWILPAPVAPPPHTRIAL